MRRYLSYLPRPGEWDDECPMCGANENSDDHTIVACYRGRHWTIRTGRRLARALRDLGPVV